MSSWFEDIVEVGCPECGHLHLLPIDGTGVPITCERCGTEFQVFRERKSRRPQPRSAYLASLRGGEDGRPPSRSMRNAVMTIVGLAVQIALLAYLFQSRDELAGTWEKAKKADEMYLDPQPRRR